MKERQIIKPLLNTAEALKFATESTKNKNIIQNKDNNKETVKEAPIKVEKNRIFFAPEGDKRFTQKIEDCSY
ncbi:hypothetical protein [Nitrosomonas communis]|uniref:hypothetical protein n=1 Tax=Nitrosomonas communis TaxID=44574 RepID=UPI003D29BB3E